MPEPSDIPELSGIPEPSAIPERTQPEPEPEADLARSARSWAGYGPALAELAGWSSAALVERLEREGLSFPERAASATLLGLIGDPRLDAREPPMIDIPSATVTIGLAAVEVDKVAARWAHVGVEATWIAKEAPAHLVAVGAFRIGRFPVTNYEYLFYALAEPDAPRPSGWAHGCYPWSLANHPVYSLPPEGADGYAAWLADQTGRAFRLPTEAEWEYAASGGDGREFPWGDQWDPLRCNTAEAGPLSTTPVGMYREGQSPFGLEDVAGNVEEYVADLYRPYPGGSLIRDDLNTVHASTYRVARGGSYARHGDLARCRRRHGWYPSDHYAVGFRLAESVA